MRTCTVPTVVNSIARLTNAGDNVLKVKRKFKTGTDGKVTRCIKVVILNFCFAALQLHSLEQTSACSMFASIFSYIPKKRVELFLW